MKYRVNAKKASWGADIDDGKLYQVERLIMGLFWITVQDKLTIEQANTLKYNLMKEMAE